MASMKLLVPLSSMILPGASVHKEKTYAPLSLIIDLSGGGQNASLAVYKRGESLRIGTLSLMYVGVRTSKVVSVFVVNDVTLPSCP